MESSLAKSNFLYANGIRLHYLDWGGEGPALVFLAGMGCSVYIFGGLAPRFTDKFHVMALDRRGHGDSDIPESGYDADTLTEDLRQFLDALQIDRVILVGHSMARVELSRFAVRYPGRVHKLVYLDAAYDTSSEEGGTVWQNSPMQKMIPAWPQDGPETIEACIDIVKRYYPSLAMIWNAEMDEQTRHTVKFTSEGKVVDKMPEAISGAVYSAVSTFAPEYEKIKAPVLSFFAIQDGYDYLSSEYMTEEQKAEVIDYFEKVLRPYQKRYIEGFQRKVPHARIVEIPNGHHYCFIKQEELVYDEMWKFLLE